MSGRSSADHQDQASGIEHTGTLEMVAGYRYTQVEGRRLMAELGNPAIILLIAYLLTLPGIVVEFFLLKSLWYYGFELYSTYVFVLSTGCVFAGFYLILRRPRKSRKLPFKLVKPRMFFAAMAMLVVCIAILVFFANFSFEIASAFSMLIVFTMILLMASGPNMERRDVLPVSFYGVGLVIVALVPVHQAFRIWGGGGGVLEFGVLDGALVVAGISVAFIALDAVRTQMGLFACWLLGATLIALISFHEFALIVSSGSFEVYDQVLALEGSVFSIVPLMMYLVREVRTARLWSHLMNASRALGRKDYESALSEIEDAMESLNSAGQSNKYSLPWSLHGDIYYAMGKLNQARTCYEMALKIDPNDSEIWANLGNMLAVKGYSDQAVAAYRKSLDLKPEDPGLWNNYGVVLLSLKKYDQALHAFQEAVERDEKYATAYYNAWMIMQRSGRPAAAMKLAEKLLEISPDDESYRRAYDRTNQLLDYFQQAAGWKLLGAEVVDLVKVLLQKPKDFDGHYREFLSGLVKSGSGLAFDGDKDLAAEALRKIMRRAEAGGEGVLKMRVDSGLTPEQLRFTVAIGILAGKFRFRAIEKEIRLVSSERIGLDDFLKDNDYEPHRNEGGGYRRASAT